MSIKKPFISHIFVRGRGAFKVVGFSTILSTFTVENPETGRHERIKVEDVLSVTLNPSVEMLIKTDAN